GWDRNDRLAPVAVCLALAVRPFQRPGRQGGELSRVAELDLPLSGRTPRALAPGNSRQRGAISRLPCAGTRRRGQLPPTPRFREAAPVSPRPPARLRDRRVRVGEFPDGAIVLHDRPPEPAAGDDADGMADAAARRRRAVSACRAAGPSEAVAGSDPPTGGPCARRNLGGRAHQIFL